MPMTGWVALGSDPAPRAADVRLRSGALLVVLGGLADQATVVLDVPEGAVTTQARQASLWPGPVLPPSSGLSLLGARDIGLVLRHRRGGQVVSHALPGPLPAEGGPLVLRLEWSGAGLDRPAGRWALTLTDAEGRPLVPSVSGQGALAPDGAAAWAVSRAGAHRLAHPALGSVGVRQAVRNGPAPEDLGWSAAAISASTPIDTPRGPRPLGTLAAGDPVLDANGRPLRLAALHLAEIPPGFPFSPLRLRAIRLPIARDLLAGPMTCLAVRGEAVQHLYGLREVGVRAGHLPDPVARRVPGPLRGLLMAVAVPETPAILAPGGLPIACPGPDGALPRGWTASTRAAAVALLSDEGRLRRTSS